MPFLGMALGGRLCENCQTLSPAFDHGRSLFVLKDAGRTFVHALKYRKQRCVLTDMGTAASLHPGFIQHLAGATLVPVPLHRHRQRQRGFNQSLLIASVFAEAGNKPINPVFDCLARTRATTQQAHLSKAQRQQNVQGAFSLKPGAQICTSRRYVLVDDVLTTGATLSACAKALKKAGASQVDVATFAHG